MDSEWPARGSRSPFLLIFKFAIEDMEFIKMPFFQI